MLLPFIESIACDQTAARLESIPECRFFFDGFGSGVDGAVFGLGFLGPGSHQSPFEGDELTPLPWQCSLQEESLSLGQCCGSV